MAEQSTPKRNVAKSILTTLLLALVTFEIVALVLWVPGTFLERLTAVFAIIGIYGLEIGFFSRSTAFVNFRGLLEDFTSPDIAKCFAANFGILAVIFALISAAFEKRSPDRPVIPYAYYIELHLLVALALPFIILAVAYAIFHTLVIAMISYLPTVLASAVVARMRNSKTYIRRTSADILIIAKIFADDELAAKGFLIGIPAALISILSAIITPFIG
jgi:hypothetical protein